MTSRNLEATLQPGMAFGVDPSRSEAYSLRQARYHEIGNFLAERGRVAAAAGQVLKVLDIGAGPGLTLRHLETHDGAEAIELYGADIKAFDRLYRPEVWKEYWVGDLMEGLPMIPSEMFDIVLCEQVLEHLSEQRVAMATIARVLKPGGTAMVGVPIFPSGVNRLRDLICPVIDWIRPPSKPRGHVQSFSKRSFVAEFVRNSGLKLEEVHGFRIISGGILKPLENHAWWYRLNHRIGKIVPGLCTEIQVIARKPAGSSHVPA